MTDKYPVMTPQQAADELGCPLTERLQPDMYNHMPRRFVTAEESKARGWSWFFPGRACRHGHIAPRRTSNDRICAGCQRLKEGLEQVHQKSLAQKFFKPEHVANNVAARTGASAATPAAPAKPLEPSKKEQEFLAVLAMTSDINGAAESVGMTRGQIESRLSVDPVFKAAFNDLIERLGIPYTRAVDPQAFVWTPEIERQLINRYVDLGLLDTARSELGIPAHAYQQHLKESSEFADAIEEARPAAEATLMERATALANGGKPELLKYLQERAAQSGDGEFVTLVNGQRVRRCDPEGDRKRMQEILDSVTAKRNKEFPAFRTAEGVTIARSDIEEGWVRDKTTGTFYRESDLEEVNWLVLNAERNARARTVKSVFEEHGDLPADDVA